MERSRDGGRLGLATSRKPDDLPTLNREMTKFF